MINIPIFQYHCLECNHEFEQIVITGQEKWPEPEQCPECTGHIEKMITAPTLIRMDGKVALQNLPDPKPPLQELRGKTRPGCEGGYKDLPDPGKLEGRKNKDGHWNWTEKKTQIHDLGKKP